MSKQRPKLKNFKIAGGGGLKRRLFFIILLSLLIAIAGTGWLLIDQTKRELHISIEHHGNSVIAYLVYLSRDDMIKMNYDALTSLTSSLNNDPMIEQIEIINHKGKLIASSDQKRIDRKKDSIYQADIKNDTGEAIGTIRLAMKEGLIDKMTKQSVDTLILIIGSLLILAPIVSYFIANSTVRLLNKFLSPLQSVTKELSQTSRELNNSSQQLSGSVNDTSSHLEYTVSSVEELSELIKYDLQNTSEVREQSEHGQQVAQQVEGEILNLINAIVRIDDSFQKIDGIVVLIESIAFQTSLLALNAAVEAARAGERGRGFAVVAESVRSLADRISASVKEIKTLVSTSREEVSSGRMITQNGQKVLKDIVHSSELVADLNKDIASASSEHAQGFALISQALGHIDTNTQNVASMAQQSSSYAMDLAEKSKLLKQALDEVRRIVG